MNGLKDTKQSSLKTGSFVISDIKPLCIKLSGIFAVILLTVILQYSGIGCVWRYFLHISCPGCGMTRAVVSALHGDFKEMFMYHFMAPSLPVLFIYVLCDGHIFKHKWVDYTILGCIGAGFLVQWIIKLL